MVIKLVREGLGRVILFVDWLTRPKQIQRSLEEQQVVSDQLKSMTLYQLYACPFCIKTRRAMHRLNLPMETRNVHRGSPYRQDLEQGGGRIQVPCLHVKQRENDIWMYESNDIISFLNQQFGEAESKTDISGQHQN